MSDERELPPDALLELLNGWPEGTRGFVEEQMLLRQLRSLGNSHGFGRVAQLAGWLAELVMDERPERVEAFRRMRRDRVAQMTQDLKHWTAPKKVKVKA